VKNAFEILKAGIQHDEGSPAYGKQDIGYSPGGAQDRFSVSVGNAMLENDPGASALEIILPPQLRFTRDVCFILTGGKLRDVLLRSDEETKEIEHARVYMASAGSTLSFGQREYGFRTYLCYRIASEGSVRLTGRVRGPFAEICRWLDEEGKIRVLEGPEFHYLENQEIFFQAGWRTTTDISDMGIRLEYPGELPRVSLENMVSAPVNDGTIQLTKSGPIILLRKRQTVGGYPRVLNVISADIDLLAQYGPHQIMRFRRVSVEVAREIACIKQEDLERLKNRFL
jgi:allophanate hydrolase subunit 2